MSTANLGLELRRLEREREIVGKCAKMASHIGFELRGIESRDLARRAAKLQTKLCDALSKIAAEIHSLNKVTRAQSLDERQVKR